MLQLRVHAQRDERNLANPAVVALVSLGAAENHEELPTPGAVRVHFADEAGEGRLDCDQHARLHRDAGEVHVLLAWIYERLEDRSDRVVTAVTLITGRAGLASPT